ncbi:hypothetical protein BV25DRAFT_1856370 [Artomyces pyxidatus]|uniref:Uncharacterized protein n=1 Tax=Artomyces pyxidatus TaxID=48021 RepID=A0ACB8T0Z5_9AGAM|nr:hypothetical protein BV25DRAFT_1856370 [Artomyces pyxidatus]
MPPPTAADAWLNSRRFGIVVDAGSSGSRLQIYSWRDPRVVRQEHGEQVKHLLPRVEKGTLNDDDWVTKVEPGISSFAESPEGITSYLAPLLEHARSHIPPSLHAETPLFLLATAGMRLLTPEQQATVLETTCHFLRFHSYFRIDGPSALGPCGSSVRIITGEEEGLFGWIAVNYLMDGFGPSNADRTTYGFLDMGGASTQIAFEPGPEERKKAQNLVDVRLRLMSGEEISHQVFVTTWLGYGTNQARERYVGQAINEYEATRQTISGTASDHEVIEDPCLPKDLRLTETPLHTGPSTSHTRKPHTLLGTGSFTQCLEQTSPLLNKAAPCPDVPCLFNGVYVPPIDFSVSRFIGVSEYWYSSEHVFGLGGAYNFVDYERAAQNFCGKDWAEILRMHEDAKRRERLGGDGEMEEGGKVIGLDKWGDKVEISRLEMQCFKAAWIINVLHDGLGMPRIVDAGGNATASGEAVKSQADQKGLGRPTFQSMDSVGDIAISWTLGKMVLEASKEVPPLFKNDPPLVDPLEGITEGENSPYHPIRPAFHLNLDDIDDKISAHLPPSFTRHSLGFPFVGLIFSLLVLLTFLLMTCRLRRYIRSCVRRFTRSVTKRDQDLFALSLEEGKSDGRPSSPFSTRPPSTPTTRRFFRNMRRLTSFWRPRPPSLQTSPHKTFLRHIPSSPARMSPLRSSAFPTSLHPLDASISSLGSTSTATSPTVGSYDDNMFLKSTGEAGEASSLSIYSRSRNSSTISLSVLVPRQPISRTSSASYLP